MEPENGMDKLYRLHHRDLEDLTALVCESCKTRIALALWRRLRELREKHESSERSK